MKGCKAIRLIAPVATGLESAVALRKAGARLSSETISTALGCESKRKIKCPCDVVVKRYPPINVQFRKKCSINEMLTNVLINCARSVHLCHSVANVNAAACPVPGMLETSCQISSNRQIFGSVNSGPISLCPCGPHRTRSPQKTQ